MTDKRQLLVNDSYEDQRCRTDNRWSRVSFCLLAALPGVLISLCVILFLLSTQPKEFNTDAEYKADTLGGLLVPMSSASGMTHPPRTEPEPAAITHAHRTLAGFAAQWLQSKLDGTKDPCEDFYSYVCGTHIGVSQLSQIAVTIRYLLMRFLNGSRIPLTNQAPWQKAAGLYKSCMSLLKNNRTETADLVTWMRSMNLDIYNDIRLQLVDPVDIIVRSSLDLGVPTILSFQPQDYLFRNKKRVIEVHFSGEERNWLKGRSNFPDSFNKDYYAMLLRWYGVKPSSRDYQLASKIVDYEKHLWSMVNDHTIEIPTYVAIGDLHTYTSPYVTKERWVNAIKTYTNGTYTAVDEILVEEPALNVLVDALKDKLVGEHGLRYLVAWSIYRQLVQYTVPHLLAKRRPASDACYDHAGKAMHLALMSPYLQRVVKPSMVEAVKTMLSNIRDALHEEFKLSSWVTGEDRTVVVRKLAYMRNFVGSPGQRLEHDYLEKLYNSYPDVPLDRLFPSWIKALSLSARHQWADSTTWRYDETQVDANYEPSQNALFIPTAIISRPLFYDEGSPAINYGALGAIVGSEMMHAYDVTGIAYDESAETRPWASASFTREYTERALCLRRSHTAADPRTGMQASRRLLLVNTDKEELSGRDNRRGTLSSLCLLAVLPGVLCCLLLAILLTSTKSKDITTNVVPIVSMSDMARAPSPEPGPLTSPDTGPLTTPAPAAIMPLSPSHYLRPPQSSSSDVCTSTICRYAAQWILSKLDSTKDPCKDFYSYVCETHRGFSTMNQVAVNIERNTVEWLTETNVPRSNQRSWEKAAGLYQACIYFLQSNRSETEDLVTWMMSLGLDLSNEAKLSRINLVDIIVRCSLDLGVTALFEIELRERVFYNNKRRVELLRWFGSKANWFSDIEVAYNIIDYENEFYSISKISGTIFPAYMAIGDLYKNTSPYVTKEDWVNAFSKYTNNTYTAADSIYVKETGLRTLLESLKSRSLGARGLRYLVAWNLYTRLVNFTLPYELGQFLKPSEVCYDHTGKAMRLALLSPYLEKEAPPSAVAAVKTMQWNIHNAFHREFESSSWVSGEDRRIAIAKLANMRAYVGSPGGRLAPDFVERLYRSYPDVPTNSLFPSWIKAVGISAQQLWVDQTTWIYDETDVNAYYAPGQNVLTIPTAIIARPLYFHGGVDALNYGGIGAIVGHEMMHAFDVQGLRYNDQRKYERWASTEFMKEYTKRAMCLRQMHRTVARQRARQELSSYYDSENLADLVGVRIAYGGFSALPRRQRMRILQSTNISAERLFFIGHCVKWCREIQFGAGRYAPDRSRCIVPLMNMPEFSKAFGCAAGDLMNPAERCGFWN
ncbi:hypothetical protein MTO96_031083 [Rhipicephalus appendiculatus]